MCNISLNHKFLLIFLWLVIIKTSKDLRNDEQKFRKKYVLMASPKYYFTVTCIRFEVRFCSFILTYSASQKYDIIKLLKIVAEYFKMQKKFNPFSAFQGLKVRHYYFTTT